MSSKSKTKFGRAQPIRATQPFQLLQQSPARRSPCSSPTPRSSSDQRVGHARHRWSSTTDHRSSPDRCDRKSPSNSPSIKVSNRRSPSPSVRRGGPVSYDNITQPYLIGQWPREYSIASQCCQNNSNMQIMRDKSTQTPDWNSEKSQPQKQKGQPKAPIASDYIFKEMRHQIRRMAKQNSRHVVDKKEKTLGNHSALSQLANSKSLSSTIAITTQCFGRVPRRQNSTEALNKEVDIYLNNYKGFLVSEARHQQGVTPPDGRRAPAPRSATRSMETQTLQGVGSVDNSAQLSRTPSPQPITNLQIETSQQTHLLSLSNTINNNSTQISSKFLITSTASSKPIIFDVESKDAAPKYASSPRPNKSYTFQRKPPEGAESVKPFKENQGDNNTASFSIGPDKNKVNFSPAHTNFLPPKISLQPIKKLQRKAITNGYELSKDVGLCHANNLINLTQAQNSTSQIL